MSEETPQPSQSDLEKQMLETQQRIREARDELIRSINKDMEKFEPKS
jgi:hypothetical protein